MVQLKARQAFVLALSTIVVVSMVSCSCFERSPLDTAGVHRITPSGRTWSPVGGISWSPDGTRLAVTRTIGGVVDDPEGYIYTVDLKSQKSQIITHTQTGAGFTSLAWSPLSDRVAVSTTAWEPYGIWLVDLNGEQEPTYLGQGSSCAWAPDGERIAIADSLGESFSIYVLNSLTGERREVFQESTTGEYATIGGISWSLRDDHLAFAFGWDDHDASTPDTMRLYELDLASGESRLLAESGWIWSPSWSPDGTMIAYSTGNQVLEITLAIIDVDEGSTVHPLNAYDVRLAAWSPYGSLIAFEWQGDVYVIDTAFLGE
ncbi:MAG: hypothetical protein GF414_00875 [Candidatus Altiarchaeales archaeon]|nr:hypothetical protein [Candidatus Altiarchaeales archaeon]